MTSHRNMVVQEYECFQQKIVTEALNIYGCCRRGQKLDNYQSLPIPPDMKIRRNKGGREKLSQPNLFYREVVLPRKAL